MGNLYSTIGEIARRLNVGHHTIKRWIEEDDLPVFRETEKGPYYATEDGISTWIKNFEEKHRKTPQD